MVSWREEIERREAAARAEIGELRARIEELTGRLAEREAALSRLEITRETMTEILSGDGAVTVPGDDTAGETPVPEDRFGTGSPVGVRLVPHWEPGLEADVLPQSYRDVVEVLADAVHPMRAHHLCAALGLSTDKSKVEGFRAKLKRLVERGWLAEDQPGLFTVAGADPAGPGAPERAGTSAGHRRAGVRPGSRP